MDKLDKLKLLKLQSQQVLAKLQQLTVETEITKIFAQEARILSKELGMCESALHECLFELDNANGRLSIAIRKLTGDVRWLDQEIRQEKRYLVDIN